MVEEEARRKWSRRRPGEGGRSGRRGGPTKVTVMEEENLSNCKGGEPIDLLKGRKTVPRKKRFVAQRRGRLLD